MGSPPCVEIKEANTELVPFTFENNCSDLVIKIKQKDEKQSWLLNPGHRINYTWDNSCVCNPECLWTVYGSCDEANLVRYEPGAIMSGQELVIYKTVRKSINSSSTSDSESESEDSENKKRRSTKSVITSNTQQNIVYKHKKLIYWVSENSLKTNKTTVSFFPTRKSALKFLRSRSQQPKHQLIVTAPSAQISVLDYLLYEKNSLDIQKQSPQWFILINSNWSYLGLELSQAIEIAYQKGFQFFTAGQFIKVSFVLAFDSFLILIENVLHYRLI